MPSFNPDQFLSETAPQQTVPASPGFNPDAFLADTHPVDAGRAALQEREQRTIRGEKEPGSYDGVPDDDLNWLQKLERGSVNIGLTKPGSEVISPASLRQKQLAGETALNTVTAGYLPQITGALKTGSVSSPEYIKARDEMGQELGQAELGTKWAGTAVGVMPALVTGPLVAGAKTFPGRVGMGAAIGGATGFAANPGDEPGKLDPLQIGERSKNAVLPAAIGAAGPLISEGGPKLVEYFKKQASQRALKQGGAMLKDYRAFDQKGTLNPTPGSGKINAGQMLLDEGVVTPFASTEVVAQRSRALAETEIGKVNAVYSALDEHFDKLAASPLRASLPTGTKVAEQLDSLLPQLDSVALQHLKGTVTEYADKFRQMGDAPLKFSKVREELQGFDQLLNWNKEQTPAKELVKMVRGKINGVLEDGVDSIGQATNFPLFEKWKEAKNKFGSAIDVADMADDKLFRNEANRFASPTDYFSGGVGATIGTALAGGPGAVIGGVIGAGGNHLMRKYGNALAATGANNAAKFFANPDVSQVAQFIGRRASGTALATSQVRGADKSTAKAPTMNLEGLAARLNGSPAQKFVGALQNAAQNGQASLAATHFILSQTEPEYQKATQQESRD